MQCISGFWMDCFSVKRSDFTVDEVPASFPSAPGQTPVWGQQLVLMSEDPSSMYAAPSMSQTSLGTCIA